eukprot:symbB.v1.2.033175.t1/scaffold4088.1/size44913/2
MEVAATEDLRWRSLALVLDRTKGSSEPAVEALALAEGRRASINGFSFASRLMKFYDSKDIKLSEVAHIAIDEADFLLTQGFEDLYKILDTVHQESRYKSQMRYTLVTASITKPLWKIFQEDKRFRTLKVLESRALHKPQANCSHTMVLTKGRCKVRLLTQIVQRDLGEESLRRGLIPRQTLVFCNALVAAKSICYQLKELFPHMQEKIGMLHKEMLTAERGEVLKKFVATDLHVLVCTDLAQRGIDLPNCQHVVNFDFPLNSIASIPGRVYKSCIEL